MSFHDGIKKRVRGHEQKRGKRKENSRKEKGDTSVQN